MVKEFLSQRSISFTERNVSQNPAYAQELVSRTGQIGVPVTIINGQTIIGFDHARLEQVIAQTQTRQRPIFGASIADASKITAKQGSGIILGAYIGSVRPNSVAARIGLASGDIITEVNLKNITSAKDLESALSRLSIGSRFTLSFLRGTKTLTAQGTF
jgi:glutaredoxin 3